MLHSIYDLTTLYRQTTGDVPPKLVGASTTVIGSKMYIFGGRLVLERRMVSDMYVIDLETLEWECIPPYPGDDIPRPRYFHSTDGWNNYLVLFGGMSNQPGSLNPEDLCVLSDVRFFDLETRRWLPEAPLNVSPEDPRIPRARYAHLSSVTANRLFVVGGQDFYNTWLDDICVFDLNAKTWIQKREYPRHCGTYRSVAVSSPSVVRFPQDEVLVSRASSTLGPPGTRFQVDKTSPLTEVTPSDALTHQPYSAEPSDDHPSEIFLYSNYNFTDVKRELEVVSPLPEADFTIEDRSIALTGPTSPPGLRFPTGAVLGNHLIIAGTYLAHTYQSFSIWVLDLVSMTWSRIDPGKTLEVGSWFRGCLWAESNKFVIFGNRNGNLVDDYNRRLLSWDHVAIVDLEAFGIYQPPPLKLDTRLQEMGLAVLEEQTLADFELVCDDGRRIPCSRKTLESRWPWFKLQRTRMLENAQTVLTQLPTSTSQVALPEIPGIASVETPQLDPRLTPRSLFLMEPWPITMALLQYLYSLALTTPLQHAPAVLSQLLILGTNYQLDHLVSLVKHAMHRSMTNSTSVGIYEVATLCSCRSLQIRALKTVMSYTQKRPKPSRHDRDSGNDKHADSGPGGMNGSDSTDGSHGDNSHTSRPRGTSDAHRKSSGGTNGNTTGYSMQGGISLPENLSESNEIRANGHKKSSSTKSQPGTTSLFPIDEFRSKPRPSLSSTPQTRDAIPGNSSSNNHRATASHSSDKWSFCSFTPTAPVQQKQSKPNQSEPRTPSRKQHRQATGNLKDPKTPPRLSRSPSKPHSTPTPKHRPSPIYTGIPTVKGSATERSHHVPNLSSSSSQSSSSSLSLDLKTPNTPAPAGNLIRDPLQLMNVDGIDDDDEFTIVLNEDEAIHWTKQTSDLRQPSPLRPPLTGHSAVPNFLSNSQESKALSPHRFPSSPSKIGFGVPSPTKNSQLKRSPSKGKGIFLLGSKYIKKNSHGETQKQVKNMTMQDGIIAAVL